jgi:hypothetical protein
MKPISCTEGYAEEAERLIDPYESLGFTDLVMLTAVWMHLEGAQRARGMPILAGLLRQGGLMLMTLRHGPIPSGRRMFEVPADETIAFALTHGLRSELNLRVPSIQPGNRLAGVMWTRLALRKG